MKGTWKDTLQLWHERMGHVNLNTLRHMYEHESLQRFTMLTID
jgi:hypothetical protein